MQDGKRIPITGEDLEYVISLCALIGADEPVYAQRMRVAARLAYASQSSVEFFGIMHDLEERADVMMTPSAPSVPSGDTDTDTEKEVARDQQAGQDAGNTRR